MYIYIYTMGHREYPLGALHVPYVHTPYGAIPLGALCHMYIYTLGAWGVPPWGTVPYVHTPWGTKKRLGCIYYIPRLHLASPGETICHAHDHCPVASTCYTACRPSLGQSAVSALQEMHPWHYNWSTERTEARLH